MNHGNVRKSIAGLLTLGCLVLAVVIFGPAPEAKVEEPVRKPRAGKPIPMPADLVGFEIHMGLKDTKATEWDGDVTVSPGRIVDMSVTSGGKKGKGDVVGNRFTTKSTFTKMNLNSPQLHVNLDATADAAVTITTGHGKVQFKVSDVGTGIKKTFLMDQVSVEKQEGSVRLTSKETEDDYPVLAKGADGTVWLTYLEYTLGPPLVPERHKAGNFDDLVPKGNGDQVLLMHFNGKEWEPALEVSKPGISAWRPTVTVDGKGVVWVAWSEQVDGDWEVFYRRYTPAKGGAKGDWSEPTRLTNAPGSDYQVVAATDSTGAVWLAWQAWRNNHFEIMLSREGKAPQVISTSKKNNWSPAIAADSKGNVYVSYDTYDKDNYDVMLYMSGVKESKTIPVATSAKFEARAHITCDGQDRVWIAYEEGDEQWGKDYANNTPEKVPVKNLGFPFYLNRTIKVKCFADGKLQQPAGDLEKAFTDSKLKWNKSVPRLVADGSGGVWMLCRHHPLPGQGGEVWDSYAFRYDGKKWHTAKRLAESANLMDNRPGLVPYLKGILTVYSGDNRTSTATRGQDDLFAAFLNPSGPTSPMELVAAEPTPSPKVAPVHPNEAADVAKMREFRTEVGGKKLQIIRGEFHRHTEYSAHRDGDGMLEDVWRYGLDAGNMDWIGVGDHDNGFGSEYCWWQEQKTTDLFQNPPTFLGALTYERSVVYPNGHRNVIMPKRGIRPLPRGELPGTADKGTPDTKMLYAYLKHFGAICSSHTSGTNMGTDWRDNDPTVEPVVEIYQGHRHNYERLDAPRAATKATNIGGFEPPGYLNNAWDKKYKLGFQSSSDHISTHMSYGMVFVEEISRQGMIDAFKKRHSYAATDNILVSVRSGDHMMGDVFTTAKKPTIDIKIVGSAPIAKVVIVRDNEYVYTMEPKTKEVMLTYTDMKPKEGKEAFYYVRVEQADTNKNLAWASPMWITYKP